MKKDLVFAPALLIVGAVLCLLQFTGMIAHIAVSVVGIALLIAYTVLTKKDWRIPALEIAVRVLYGIAIISGIVIMNLSGLAALAVIHKISAVLFMVGIIILLVSKMSADDKKA